MNQTSITATAVNAMLAPFDMRVANACQIATKGVENLNIFLPGRTWVLRRYRSLTVVRAEREVGVLEHLHARGFPVPAVRRACDGAPVVKVDGYATALLGFLPGVDLEGSSPSPTLAYRIGRLTGLIAKALARTPVVTVDPPPHELTSLATARARLAQCRRPLATRTPDSSDASHPHDTGIPWALVERCLADIEQRMLDWSSLPRQLIHGDLSGQNILTEGDRITGVLDFGDLVESARVADIAIAICHLGLSAGRARATVCRALWKGWCDVINPTAAERSAVRSLILSRCCKLIIDHVWRDQHGQGHPGHQALIAAGVHGLLALTTPPSQSTTTTTRTTTRAPTMTAISTDAGSVPAVAA